MRELTDLIRTVRLAEASRGKGRLDLVMEGLEQLRAAGAPGDAHVPGRAGRGPGDLVVGHRARPALGAHPVSLSSDRRPERSLVA